MPQTDKPLVWLHGEVKSPPFTKTGPLEAGFLLRLLQQGKFLTLPKSRPMPSIGARCHELRIRDEGANWRIVYRIDPDAILILEVFKKQSPKTSQTVIDVCKKRLQLYDTESGEP